ncbi:Pre-rRNA-processing protein rix1 [Tolypocladium ophioglossoides CBS 100239]|uniref:Pre-rRNA-processing protein RIX1 n=1 Tax=Tolypocladium ophioglossoides (strain CBS 100239) TaxID=1163406 RepID=A0A0L0N1G7_TOLOC|nr:Pre-rRNA-processing protein rix1 [Tolypocladium ophioglossoides CBS 100239]
MSFSPPPDLRVLCRNLTSIPPAQLPHALPALTRHIVRCRDALSAPQEQKPKDDASQGSLLLHRLKTNITTLLNGRSREARFAAIGLVKALVDVGGWEMLRASGPWVSGLLSIIQKGDSFAAKELAVVTLTRIYMLVHPYQTLVREIATPTIPAFVTACLQLIKPPASGLASTSPLTIVETICGAFSALIPLYATTFRPYGSQIRSAVRGYLAPTSSDGVFIPRSLQRASGQLVASLHHVAAKSGGSDEWAKMVDGVLRELHATSDQVLRAVDESWEATGGYGRTRAHLNGEPSGGGASADQFPPWAGLSAGAERLVGLFHHLSDCLRCPTKGAVTIPVGYVMDAISRVCLIARLSPKSQTWDQALDTNPAIGREEKEELWSVMPDIHVAAMELILMMLRRLDKGMLPLVPEALDHLIRVFKSGMNMPVVRKTGYRVLNGLVSLAGPTMSKTTVAMLEPLVAACCRDLQQDAGFVKPTSKPAASSKDSKKNGVANADLFLQPQASAAEEVFSLDPDHKAAADNLLPMLLASLPQQHLRPTLRGLLDKTAILTRNRNAMLSSVLNPYKDQRGRMYPNILPHLSRQYPQNQGLEVLRSNLRVGSVPGGGEMLASVHELPGEEEEDIDDEMADAEETAPEADKDVRTSGTLPAAPQVEINLPVQTNPFETRATGATRADSPPKRKHEGSDSKPPKRQEVEKPAPAVDTVRVPQPLANEDAEDDDSDGSVHLNMELDDDEDDDEDE